MDKKAILAMAILNLSFAQNKNQIVDDLNDFSIEELLEFREKILEQKQNIESTIEEQSESTFLNETVADQDENLMQLADMDGLFERIEEAVEERNN